MRVYQSADGKWILRTGSEKIRYDTEVEAMSTQAKIEFAEAVQTQMSTLAKLFNQSADLSGIWGDRDYLNQITDADLESLGITKAQLTAGITLFAQLLNVADNAAVAQGDYRATVNVLRSSL